MDSKNFVTYEQALVLKELGFNENCSHYYENDELVASHELFYADEYYFREEYIISVDTLSMNFNDNSYDNANRLSAPTLEQAQNWLKDNKNIYPFYVFILKHSWNYVVYDVEMAEPIKCSTISYNSWEEALSAAIDKCLEILKE